MSEHAEIVRRLRIAREQQGLTYRELGRRCYLGASTIHAWENGDRSPTLFNLLNVARVLGFDLKLVER
jgi:transcriptional regulator with XRE-family HTH domain